MKNKKKIQLRITGKWSDNGEYFITTEPKEYLAVNMFYPTFLVSKYGQMHVEDLASTPSILKEFEVLKELKQQYEDMTDKKMKSSFYIDILENHVLKINGLLEGLDVLKGVEIVGLKPHP